MESMPTRMPFTGRGGLMPHWENPLVNHHRQAAYAEGKKYAFNIEMEPLRQVEK
jgi:hypothetical protein